MPVSELVEKMFRERHSGYPVLSEKELKGCVTMEDIRKLPVMFNASHIPADDRSKLAASFIANASKPRCLVRDFDYAGSANFINKLEGCRSCYACIRLRHLLKSASCLIMLRQ